MFERIKEWISGSDVESLKEEKSEETRKKSDGESELEEKNKLDYIASVKKMKNGDKFSIIKLDIIRILLDSFGTRWKSELLRDLNVFRRHLGRMDISKDDFEDMLKELVSGGFVESDDRPRATRKGGEPDSLISLKYLEETRKALSGDEDLKKYRESQRM